MTGRFKINEHEKNTIVAILFLGLSLMWFACEEDYPNPGGEVSATVTGIMMYKNGNALSGVSLSPGTSNVLNK